MIVTDLGSDNGKQGLHDMDDMVREGVASFKLFMAYQRLDGGRRNDLQGAATDLEEWRSGLHACRE
jgi:hypothetical protein